MSFPLGEWVAATNDIDHAPASRLGRGSGGGDEARRRYHLQPQIQTEVPSRAPVGILRPEL
jgi:hypothetical protein